MANFSRVVPGPNQDNTGRQITQDYQTPAYAATLAPSITAQRTTIKVGTLTGAVTINVGVGSATTGPYVGDEIIFLFAADGTDRVVTFGTGCVSTGTLTVAASKFGRAAGIFDGARWQVSSFASV